MSSEEKTEKPTARKLKKTREEGQVARSADVAKATIFVVLGIYLYFQFSSVASQIGQFMESLFVAMSHRGSPNLLGHALQGVQITTEILLPALVLVGAVALAADFFQAGPMLAFKAVMPKPERIHPVEGFKRVFSKRSLMKVLMAICKMVTIGLCLYFVIHSFAADVLALAKGSIGAGLQVGAKVMASAFLWSAVCLVIVAVIDYAVERQIWYREQFMTKTEIKREQKEDTQSNEVRQAREEARGDDPVERMFRNIEFCQVMVIDGGGSVLGLYDNPAFKPDPLVIVHASGVMGEKVLKEAKMQGIRVIKDARFTTQVFSQTQSGVEVPPEFQARARQLIAE